MSSFDRRNFLKASGLAVVPALIPGIASASDTAPPDEPIVKFFYDGEDFNPAQYIDALQKISSKEPIRRDFYMQGGVVDALQKKFEAITGKEKAIYLPTGTMANQLALALLSGNNTKVFVQDLSHVYRDEADAAQSVHNKRLMPLAMEKTYFTAAELEEAVEQLKDKEVFQSGTGVVSIENPVRRAEGRRVPVEEIRKISEFCRSRNIPLHLDGARLYMAAAWSGTSIKEYAGYFDTVYISLYKYLGAAGGAILCGPAKIIDQVPHLIKIHGGSVFAAWPNAAMALHRLEGFEERLKEAIGRSKIIFDGINAIPGLKVTALEGGTNIHPFNISAPVNGANLQQRLNKEFNIRIPPPNEKGMTTLTVNETLLYKEPAAIISAFRTCAG